MTAHREIAPAKLNLALHVRGTLPDGRHAIETIFAFCTDGDRLSAEPADALTLEVTGPFAAELDEVEENLVLRAARALQNAAELALEPQLRSTKSCRLHRALVAGPRTPPLR